MEYSGKHADRLGAPFFGAPFFASFSPLFLEKGASI